MGFFRDFFKKQYEKKMTTEELAQIMAKKLSYGSVTPELATNTAVVYACAKIISEDVAKLPLHVYKSQKNVKIKDDSHPLAKLLAHTPNEYHTAIEFREWLTWDLVLKGECFAYINRSETQKILEILPLSWNSVEIEKIKNGQAYDVQYYLKSENNGRFPVKRSEILHIRDQTLDGIRGVSRIVYLAKAIAFSNAIQDFGFSLFSSDATPGGVITHPLVLSPNTAEKLRLAFDSQAAKRGNVVLDEGMTWTRTGMSAEDAQFLDSRKFQRDDILQGFRMPPHKVGDLSRATFSNIEQKEREYLSDTLSPWLIRHEQAYYRDLLTEDEKDTYYIKHNVNGILRTDIQARYDAYTKGISFGLNSPNECRELEDLPPREDGEGDKFFHPANLVEAGKEPAPSTNQNNQGQNDNFDPNKLGN